MGPQGGATATAHLLEVDVGADQHVIEQEDPALLGLDQLPTVAIYSLCQRLTEEQLPLARGQQLGEVDRARSTPTSTQAVTDIPVPKSQNPPAARRPRLGEAEDRAGPTPPPLG